MSDGTTDVGGVTTALDELRAEYAGRVAEPRLFKRFPSRTGKLGGEFRPVPKDKAEAALEQKSDTLLLNAALVRILRYAPEHPEANDRGLIPLGAWAGQPDLDPLGFDNRLAELVGIPGGDVP